MPTTTKHTPISEVDDREPHLIRSYLLKDLTVTGAAITKTLQAVDEYANGIPYGVITDSSNAGFPSVTRDAFPAAKDLVPYPLFKAHALVVTQSGIRLIVNFFLRTFPLRVPHKMFDNEAEALWWVRTEVLNACKTDAFRILVTVTGKVQGVFFRKHCQEEAVKLGITGYVKNQSDGSVFIDASARGETLLKFLTWCQHGPSKAHVKNVTFEFRKAENTLSKFLVQQ